MKLETAYYTSQLVVAVAVVLSLITLSQQISQNTEALEYETTSTAASQAVQELMLLTAPNLARLWDKLLTASRADSAQLPPGGLQHGWPV